MERKVKFINLSSHPAAMWEEGQLNAALKLGDVVVDIAFPTINPSATSSEVERLAMDYAFKVEKLAGEDLCVVHVMGESGFVTAFVFFCKFPCYHSTTERVSIEKNGIKTSVFQFVQFRQYFQP